jgi:hypothetical protein
MSAGAGTRQRSSREDAAVDPPPAGRSPLRTHPTPRTDPDLRSRSRRRTRPADGPEPADSRRHRRRHPKAPGRAWPGWTTTRGSTRRAIFGGRHHVRVTGLPANSPRAIPYCTALSLRSASGAASRPPRAPRPAGTATHPAPTSSPPDPPDPTPDATRLPPRPAPRGPRLASPAPQQGRELALHRPDSTAHDAVAASQGRRGAWTRRALVTWIPHALTPDTSAA